VIWDNRSTVHARTDFPADERRLLKRGKVAGAAMVAA
jgi:alpha-ketoglutarate-dependent taurine dioxygenase